MATNKSAIERLEKRKAWLDNRIEENIGKDMSYDKAESSALEYAIAKLKDKEKPVQE